MATNDANAGTDTLQKHDDFFDEPPKQIAALSPEPPKEAAAQSPEPPKEAVIKSPEPPKEKGDVAPENPTPNGVASPVPQENGDKAADDGQNADDEQSAGDGVNAAQVQDSDEPVVTSDEVKEEQAPESGGADDVVVNGSGHDGAPDGMEDVKNEPADEGLQSTSPTPPVVMQVGEDSVPVDENQEGADKDNTEDTQTTPTSCIDLDRPPSADHPTEEPPEQHTEQQAEPEAEAETKEDPKQDQGGGQEAEEESQVPAPELEERKSPSGGEDDYEDSFADDQSQNEAEAAPVVTTDTPKAEEEEQVQEGDAGETETDPQRPAVSPSPSDCRAEASAVIPVVPVASDQDQANANDGRSSATPEEQNELYRGEDRKEEPAPEGSEDCRGQGQWKSEEHQHIASAMLVQKNERQAMEEAVKEKEKIFQEYSEAKARLANMEEELMKRDDKIAVGQELLCKRDKDIIELRGQLENLKSHSMSEEEVDFRVKDLQERLAILARENESKDKRIAKLAKDLDEVTEKLKQTESRLSASEASNSQLREAPKSKTCLIM